MQKKLRVLKSKTPKDYWKILIDVDKKQGSSRKNKIELDSLYDFFKDLNYQDESSGCQTLEDLNFSSSNNDEILNSNITDSEILRCIRSLKNNKACSNDNIINEYIKSTSDKMLPLY